MSNLEQFNSFDEPNCPSYQNPWLAEDLFSGPVVQRPRTEAHLQVMAAEGGKPRGAQGDQPAQATAREATAMQRLAGSLFDVLDVWKDLQPAQRRSELANYQGQVRDAIVEALRQDFLQGVTDNTLRLQTIREIMARPQILEALNGHLRNHGFEATGEANAIVFHTTHGERNMLRVELGQPQEAQLALPQDARPVQHANLQNLQFGRGLHQLYVLQWIFDPKAMTKIIHTNFNHGWGSPEIREESLRRLNSALAPHGLVARTEIVDRADKANGWQLVIETTDRPPVIRGRARPRPGMLVFNPEHDAVINRDGYVDWAATVIHRLIQNGCNPRPEQQTLLFSMFMQFETPAGLSDGERARRVGARDQHILELNQKLKEQGYKIEYRDNHDGAPALAVYNISNPIKQGNQVVPNNYLRLRPAVPPEDLVPSDESALARAWAAGGFLAGAGTGAGIFALWYLGGQRAGEWLRYLGYEFWAPQVGPPRPVLRVEPQARADTVRRVRGGTALSGESVRLADATIYIDHNGARVAVSREQAIELARCAITESRRQIQAEMEAIRSNRRISEQEKTRQLSEAQTRLNEVNQTPPENVRLEFEPGTRRISKIRVGGFVLGAAAVVAIISAWLRSRNTGGPHIQPITR